MTRSVHAIGFRIKANHISLTAPQTLQIGIQWGTDALAFLYRAEYATDNVNLAEIIVTKQRNGPTDPAFAPWREDYTSFTNMT